MPADADFQNLPESYWRQKLTPTQYAILRENATEPRFSGALYNNQEPGIYKCAACGQTLFSSSSKYDSGSGWPSFYNAISNDHITLHDDHSFGMQRIEVRCSRCGSHLGHVFPGESESAGDYYCINSGALNFEPQTE